MKHILKQALTAAVAVFIVFYAIMQLSLTAGDEIETEHAFYSVVEDAVNAEGYIFRDETVIMQSAIGTRSYMADNGERVHVGQSLCVTYQSSDEAGVQERINELNAQIDVLKQSTGGYFADLGKINESIADYMHKISVCVNQGDLQAAKRLEKSLLVQMNRRQATVEENGEYFTSRVSELEREKAVLEAGLSGVKVTTTASAAGYFYTETDGYEGSFSAAALENMTLDGFKQLITTGPNHNLTANAVGKIADSSKWYVAFTCGRRQAVDFEEGKSYTVSFPYSETEIDMVLERSAGKNGSDEMMLIFSSHTLLTGFNFARKQDISVVKSTAEGLKVRISALRYENGEAGVYVLSGSRIKFKTAKVIRESGGFYLIELPDSSNKTVRSATRLSLHDLVILNGKNLYVGKVLQ
ncbi:MAG: hypothetical protein IKK83_05785 [Clostridia bacterium]|nr:hypothetical protein [Clostridia bacterium]